MPDEIERKLAALKDNYIAALPSKIDAIKVQWMLAREHKAQEKVEELHRLAHSLAGSAATFDQTDISKQAKVLENYIKDHSASNDTFEDANIQKVDCLIEEIIKCC